MNTLAKIFIIIGFFVFSILFSLSDTLPVNGELKPCYDGHGNTIQNATCEAHGYFDTREETQMFLGIFAVVVFFMFFLAAVISDREESE